MSDLTANLLFLQVERVEKGLERVVLSATERSSVTTSRESLSPPFVVLPVVVV